MSDTETITREEPIKKLKKKRSFTMGVGVVFLAVAALLATSCTPSNGELEQRATGSVLRARGAPWVNSNHVRCNEDGTSTHESGYYKFKTWNLTCSAGNKTVYVSSTYSMNGAARRSANVYVYGASTGLVGRYDFEKSGNVWHFKRKVCGPGQWAC